MSQDQQTVYVGSYDNSVYAIHTGTGTLRWNFTTGDHVYSSPTANRTANRTANPTIEIVESRISSDDSSNSDTTAVGVALGVVVFVLLVALIAFRIQACRLKHQLMDVRGMQTEVVELHGKVVSDSVAKDLERDIERLAQNAKRAATHELRDKVGALWAMTMHRVAAFMHRCCMSEHVF